MALLGEWRLGGDEIPVVLFVARRAGISAEALVALRRSGKGWAELTTRYRLDAAQFHVPLPDQASGGVLAPAFERYRALPVARWAEIALTDGDIVGLVNLRVLASTLRMSPEAILREARGGSWYALYARLIRSSGGRSSGEPSR